MRRQQACVVMLGSVLSCSAEHDPREQEFRFLEVCDDITVPCVEWEEMPAPVPDPVPPPPFQWTFKNVKLYPLTMPEFAGIDESVRKNIYIHTDCPPNAKYLLLLSNGGQGIVGYHKGTQSRVIGLQDDWRIDNCPGDQDCELTPSPNGLTRRIEEGNLLPMDETCRIHVPDNGSRYTDSIDRRASVVTAFAAYIDRLVDETQLEFIIMGAASRGGPVTLGAILELIENRPGDPSVPGSGWASVPFAMSFSDPVFAPNEKNIYRSPTKVENPIVNEHWSAQNDKWHIIDFRAELGESARLGLGRLINVVGGDSVAPPAHVRSAGTSHFAAAQAWAPLPIEVFAEKCPGASDPYYVQLNVRYPLTHSELNGTLDTAQADKPGLWAGQYTINPGKIYDTAILDAFAAALIDHGVRPSGYDFVDGSNQAINPTSTPTIRMADGTALPGHNDGIAGITRTQTIDCPAPAPPPSCEDSCDEDLDDCMDYFCGYDPDPVMCAWGCDEEYFECLQEC